MNKIWGKNWREDAYQALKDRGFSSFLQYARANETASFEDLAVELGGSTFAPIQIQKLIREEVSSPDDLQYYMVSSLVRYLHFHVPDGIREHGDWKLHLALGSWAGSMNDAKQSQCTQIMKKLKDLLDDCENNWLPQSVEDPILINAFE